MSPLPPYFFWVYRDKAAQWRWTLWSWNNHERIADGAQGFSSLQACEKNIALVKRVAPAAPVRHHANAR